MKNINKKIAITSALVVGSVTASYADAATDIAGGVDFTTVAAAVGVIGGALGTLYLGIKGAKVVISMIKGG
jgi:hypothetical protein